MTQDIFPKISIVTPSFNQASFIEATIQSIIAQNYPNLEYVIIDGGSTDGSIEIIKKYEKHLHYWCSEPDNGQYDAINKGFSHTSGEIMAWLNSDDMYCSWALKTVGSIMSELPRVDWLTTLNQGLWDWHGFSLGFSQINGFSKDAFLDGCYLPISNKLNLGWIQQESTFWRRTLWEKAGNKISTEFELAGDFDLWASFYCYSDLYGTICPLGGFRSQNNQKTRNLDQYISEAKISLSRVRNLNHWKPNKLRELFAQIKPSKIPKLRKLLEPIYPYSGRKIERIKFNSSSGFWKDDLYKFFV